MKGLKLLLTSCGLAMSVLTVMPAFSYADGMMMDNMMKTDTKAEVAAKGFCPVCLIHGMAMKGSDNFTTEYKGKIYKFSSIEMQKEFINNPDEVASQDLDAKYQALMKK